MHRLFELIEVDNANANDIQRWNQALSIVTQHELHAMNIEKVFDQWTLSNAMLNPNSLGQAAYNIERQHLMTSSGMLEILQRFNQPK